MKQVNGYQSLRGLVDQIRQSSSQPWELAISWADQLSVHLDRLERQTDRIELTLAAIEPKLEHLEDCQPQAAAQRGALDQKLTLIVAQLQQLRDAHQSILNRIENNGQKDETATQ